MTYTLAPDGDFRRNGERYIPIGVNYWPASCGVEMWQEWPADEIRRDLDLLAELGLDCIRFFLRWQDFEPVAGVYDQKQFERLRQFVGWCGERGIAAHPSLFVGFMSGGVFWPQWKGNRNLFSDPEIVARAEAFASAAANALKDQQKHILAVDQGNEICCLGESSAASPANVAEWCRRISAAIHLQLPGITVISGNEQNQIVNDTGWRFGAQAGCDLYSMHSYPVPSWHNIGFAGMNDPLCQELLPFFVRCARAFGPVFVQEFGTIATFGAAQQDAYLRAILPACRQAGANGFLMWCFRDVMADVHPYTKNGMESTLGLVDFKGKIKPGWEYFLEFAKSFKMSKPPSAKNASIGIVWPEQYYDRENQLNPGNKPVDLSRRMIIANHLLRNLGHNPEVVRTGNIPAHIRTLILPGTQLVRGEIQQIEAFVRAGGQVLWHGPAAMNLGYDAIRLLGAVPVEYAAANPTSTQIFGAAWDFPAFPQKTRVIVTPSTGRILASDEFGPIILENQLGQGRIRWTVPLVEDGPAAVSHLIQQRDVWSRFYAGMLGEK